jgi:hypothetical protein
MAYKGHYSPKNYKKYIGDPTKITYRSLWERKVMVEFDKNPNVIEWNSEGVIIPYYYPVDGQWHKYHVDFYVKYKTKDGNVRERLIEVKPINQCISPKPAKTGKQSRKYYSEAYVFAKNKSKWEAAKTYAASKNWEFIILTEKGVFNQDLS